MATISELRQQAKAHYQAGKGDRRFKGYSRMNKAGLEALLGQGAQQPQKPAPKSSTGKKFETSKTSGAVAHAIAKKTGGNAKEIHESLKKKLQAAITKKRAQLKKEGREATPKDLRAAAVLAIKQSAREALKGKVASEERSKRTGAKVEPVDKPTVKHDSAPFRRKPKPEPKAEPKPEEKVPEAAKTKTDRVKAEDFTSPAKLSETRKELISTWGESKVQEVEAKLSKFAKEAAVYIRVPGNEILEKIIGDRFKSQFEAKASVSIDSTDLRSKAENESMGYSQDTAAKDRPIYGYLARNNAVNSEEGYHVKNYGNIAIRLKPEVKERTTFTGGDSLDAKMLASPLLKPSAASLVNFQDNHSDTFGHALTAKHLGDVVNDDSQYVETQIHGQVHPHEIAELVYHGDNDPPSKAILSWAKQNNVKVSVR